MSALILLNGPRGCGKSAAAQHLKTLLPLVDRQCKTRLHDLTRLIFDVDEKLYWQLYEDRKLKEQPHPAYRLDFSAYARLQLAKGMSLGRHFYDGKKDPVEVSPRDAMIYVSECLVKPSFGAGYFGRYRVDSMAEHELAIDDSTGFIEELWPAIHKLGQENLLLIRVYGRGEANNDSRVMIPDGVIDNTVDIDNGPDRTLGDFLQDVSAAVQAFLEGRKGSDAWPMAAFIGDR